MMLPPKVRRSTIAAQRRGSVKVLVQPLKVSLLAIATEAFSSRSVSTWKRSSVPALVQSHVAQFVDTEQVHSAVAGDGLGQGHLVGGFDEFVDEWCRWGAPNATDVSQTWGPPGCTERNDYFADLGFLRWLALKRAFF
jgi:hypothetical protein